MQYVPGAKAGNYFSYFTIESNIIAFITLGIGGWFAWKGESPRWLELLRGAATVYMTITGITYSGSMWCCTTPYPPSLSSTGSWTSIVDWYPYPFLDPGISGYGTVAIMSVLIALAAFVFATVAALSTKLQNSVPHPATAAPSRAADAKAR